MNKFQRIIREENNRVKQLIGNDFALTDPSVIDAIHHSNFDYEKAKQSPEYLAILEAGYEDVSNDVQQKHGTIIFMRSNNQYGNKYGAFSSGYMRQNDQPVSHTVQSASGIKSRQIKIFSSYKEEFEWILKNIAKNSKKK